MSKLKVCVDKRLPKMKVYDYAFCHFQMTPSAALEEKVKRKIPEKIAKEIKMASSKSMITWLNLFSCISHCIF